MGYVLFEVGKLTVLLVLYLYLVNLPHIILCFFHKVNKNHAKYYCFAWFFLFAMWFLFYFRTSAAIPAMAPYKTPATGHMIQLISHLIVKKLIPR